MENKKREARLFYSGQVFIAKSCSSIAEKEQKLLPPWFPPGEEGKARMAT